MAVDAAALTGFPCTVTAVRIGAGYVHHLRAANTASLGADPREEDWEVMEASDSEAEDGNGGGSESSSVDDEFLAGAGKRRRKKQQSKRERERERVRDDDDDDGSNRIKLYVSQDHYKNLELAAKYRSTADDIKTAYRRMVLKTHPDKNPNVTDSTAFERVQLAYEVLGDPRLRRCYDSQYKCDDRIPSDEDDSAEFFATFAPVFKRNARWSQRTPVPELGDDATDLAAVDAFYAFWFDFVSWRDFTFLCEHDLSKVDDRFVRRQMKKENEREARKRKSAENIRLRRLVELAAKRDPRLARRKAEADAAKAKADAEARERAAAARRETEEKAARAKAEADRIETERREREAAESRDLKQRIKKAKQALRKAATAVETSFETVEKLCTSLDLAGMETLLGELGADPRAAIEAAHAAVLAREAAAAAAAAEETRARAQAREVKEMAPWTRTEISELAKAVAKFPGGHRNRWDAIANWVGTRTPDECKRQVTQFRDAELSKPSVVATAPEGKSAVGGRKKGGSAAAGTMEADVRYDVVNADSQVTVIVAAPPPSAAAAATAAAAPAAASPTAAAAAGPPADGWTGEQQKALELALKKHPASLGAERWTAVAAEVPGRTKKECKERFKTLVAFYSAQKK